MRLSWNGEGRTHSICKGRIIQLIWWKKENGDMRYLLASNKNSATNPDDYQATELLDICIPTAPVNQMPDPLQSTYVHRKKEHEWLGLEFENERGIRGKTARPDSN